MLARDKAPVACQTDERRKTAGGPIRTTMYKNKSHQRELDLSIMGDRIAHVRRLRNLSQQELAELTDMNPEEVSRIETGARFPNTFKVIALAKALFVQ